MWGRHMLTQKQGSCEKATFDIPQLHEGAGFALLLLPAPDGILRTSPPTLLQPGEEKKMLRNLPL